MTGRKRKARKSNIDLTQIDLSRYNAYMGRLAVKCCMEEDDFKQQCHLNVYERLKVYDKKKSSLDRFIRATIFHTLTLNPTKKDYYQKKAYKKLTGEPVVLNDIDLVKPEALIEENNFDEAVYLKELFSNKMGLKNHEMNLLKNRFLKGYSLKKLSQIQKTTEEKIATKLELIINKIKEYEGIVNPNRR